MLPRIAFHFHNGANLFAGVFCVPFIDDFPQRLLLLLKMSAITEMMMALILYLRILLQQD